MSFGGYNILKGHTQGIIMSCRGICIAICSRGILSMYYNE